MSNTWDKKIFDGAFVAGGAGTLEITAPATGKVIATVGRANTDDLEKAVASASQAQRTWAALPYTERAAVVTKAAALLAAGPSGSARQFRTVPRRPSGA